MGILTITHIKSDDKFKKDFKGRVKEELGFDNVYIARKGLEIELTKEEF